MIPYDDLIATGMVGLPLLAALLISLSNRWTRWGSRAAGRISAAASVLSAALALLFLANTSRGVSLVWSVIPEVHFDLAWRLNEATLALVVLVAGIGAVILQYSGEYFADAAEGPTTIALLAFFETSMLGLIMADNLLFSFIFWELTGICSFFLIRSDRSKGATATRASNQALLITAGGGLSLLVGIIFLESTAGTLSIEALSSMALNPATRMIAFALILPAVITKSAQFPTHFWLPGAMTAPTPVSAYLHSATMVKAGIILLLYLYPVLGGTALWTWTLLPLGAITCLWGSLRALGEKDIKLLMAWSTVSQLGLLTVTIGLGTDVAIRAAILHLFAHAIFKAGLFLVVGDVDHLVGTRSLDRLGGLGRRAPALATTAAILAGSMAGIPPLAGFLSKELILKKAMLVHLGLHSIAITTIVLGSIGTVAYSSRFFFEVFTGQPRGPENTRKKRLPWALLLPPAILALVTLVAGPSAPWVDRYFLEPVAMAVVLAPLEVKSLSLWYGLNAALVLSLVIVSSGALLDRILGLRYLPAWPQRPFTGVEIFERLLEVCQRIGAWLVRIFASQEPRTYFALALVCALFPALMLLPGLGSAFAGGVPVTGALIITVMAIVLAALVASSRALPRILLMTAIGFCVAMLFRQMNGPDLMLTQLLVEVAITVFFALALSALPASTRAARPSAQKDRWAPGRIMIAGASGVAAAGLIPALMGMTRPDHVASFVRQHAAEIAQGDNLVNVVLTDVRSLDTFLETLVVILGAFGIVALMRGHETTLPSCEQQVSAPDRDGLLPGMARLILPIGLVFGLTLLLKGHNEPGGGFVAGLSLGACLLLAITAFGPERVCRRLPISPTSTALIGALIMVAVGIVGPMTGDPFLTQYHGAISLAGWKLKLHTTLLFDIGVMLAVGSSLGAAGLVLWPKAFSSAASEENVS